MNKPSAPRVKDDSADKVEAHASPERNGETEAARGPAPLMSDRVRALRLQKSRSPVTAARRRWVWPAAIVLLVIVAVYAWRQRAGGGRSAEREVEAVTASSERPLDIVLDTTGYIIAHSVVKVNSRIPGTVARVCIEEGQRVKKDEPLVLLDDKEYRADLDHAKAALAVARAQLDECCNPPRPEEVRKAKAALEQAEAHKRHTAQELQRANQLKGTIAPSEYDRIAAADTEAKAAVTQAAEALHLVELGPRKERRTALEEEVHSAEALVAKAQHFFDGTRILSPVSGTVLQRSVEIGEIIRLESITGSLCTIADLNSLEAEIDVQERDLADIRQGLPCLVTTDAYPDREYEGKVDWLSPVFNRQRGVRRVKVKITTPDEMLSPDMNCRVQILKQRPPTVRNEMVFVPKEAVLSDGAQGLAFVLEGEVARRRIVEVGKTTGGKVEICNGIAGGETVLLPGDKPLEDGQKVKPRMKQKKGKK